LLAVSAFAGTIDTLDPASITAGTGEYFLTIRGSKLGTIVAFSGPAGKFDVEVQSQDVAQVVAWVPERVVNTPGTYSVSVRDAAGESNVVRFIVNKPSTERLSLLMPDAIVVDAISAKGTVVKFKVTAQGGDDPSPVVKCDPDSGSLFPIGSTEVHCTAENRFGERAVGNVSVFVHDSNGPLVSVPDRIIVFADSKEGTVVKYDVRAVDEIDGEFKPDCKPVSGSLFPIGVTTVECVAYDTTLNPGYGYFDVEVREKGVGGTLILRLPDLVRVEANSRDGALVNYNVSVSGTADPAPVIKCDTPSGSSFRLGVTNVQCSASDRFGADAKGQFDVVVSDTTAPQLSLRDITAEGKDGGANVTFDWTAYDIVDGKLSVACSSLSGSFFPIGRNYVECYSTDFYGNTVAGTFYVTVVDTIPPMITSVGTAAAAPSADTKLVDVSVDVAAVDANDPMPRCRATTITANEVIDAPGRSNAEPDWLITGPLTVRLRAEQNGDKARIYTIHVACADGAGNEAESATDFNIAPSPSRRRAAGRH
ncbi:MAG: hypothetical protein QOH21_2225, partial [Acidobacteriota bacterium]|nr:hypothetical protein [Acidobacteriota bacterium]